MASEQKFEPRNLLQFETPNSFTGSPFNGPLCSFEATYRGKNGRGHFEQFNLRRVKYDGNKIYPTGAGLTVNLDEKADFLAAVARFLSAHGYTVKLVKATKPVAELIPA